MSKWAESIREFSQLITPDGKVYDLHTASRNGRWVISSQGYGMPGIDYVVQSHPFQHGATVRDYRLTPRTIQLLLHQSFCDREALWAGRSALIESLRPNLTTTGFLDYWLPRSQGSIQESVYSNPQLTITSLCEYNGLLYASTGDDGSGTGGLLLVWDGGSAWSVIAGQGHVIDGATTQYGTKIHALLNTTLNLPKYTRVVDSSEGGNLGPITNYIYSLGNTTWCAQTFTPIVSFDISQVKLYLSKSGRPGILTVSIKSVDISDNPTGADLCSGTIDTSANGMIAYRGWHQVNFTVPLNLVAGTKYAIVVRCPALLAPTSRLNWDYNPFAVYPGGEMEISWDSGATWGIQTGDYMFNIISSLEVQDGTQEDKIKLWAGCGVNGILQSWDGRWSPNYHRALQYLTETDILSLVKFGEELYGGTSPGGMLLKYDRTAEEWIQTANTLAATAIYSLIVYDDGGGETVFGGTDGGLLYKLDTDHWDEVAGQADGTETAIRALVVYQSRLFGAGNNGILYQYDNISAWVAITTTVVDPLYTLIIYKGRLYGAGEDGQLYRWDNAVTWEVICTISGSEEVRSLAIYQNRLFGGTDADAYLLEYMRDMLERKPVCTVLRRVLANGQARDLCVYVTQGPQFDANNGKGWEENSFEELLRFTAYNPVMWDPVIRSVNYLIPTGVVSVSMDITYTGTWEEHPTLILTGPLENPIITHELLGNIISLDYNIPAGDQVTIDLGNMTIQDNHNVNLLGMLAPNSDMATFRLEPDPVLAGGINTILIVAGGGDVATSDFEVKYYRRFIGI